MPAHASAGTRVAATRELRNGAPACAESATRSCRNRCTNTEKIKKERTEGGKEESYATGKKDSSSQRARPVLLPATDDSDDRLRASTAAVARVARPMAREQLRKEIRPAERSE